jgi:hypothetical protein
LILPLAIVYIFVMNYFFETETTHYNLKILIPNTKPRLGLFARDQSMQAAYDENATKEPFPSVFSSAIAPLHLQGTPPRNRGLNNGSICVFAPKNGRSGNGP